MDKKLQVLESFPAQGSDGKAYKVCGHEHLMREVSVIDSPERWAPTGVSACRLDDGRRVDVRADGSMRIAGADVVLTPAVRTAA